MNGETIRLSIAAAAFLAAVVFGIGGVAGLFRFSEPYTRLQAGSLCGTTTVLFVFLGTLALADSWAMAGRIILLSVFFLISAPTGSHIVARFIWHTRGR